MTDAESAEPHTKRSYRSTVRDERADETRRRIAAAAQDLFVQHGFAGTTVADIAERAGVATPTVYATFGSKGAIIKALLTQMEGNADSASWIQRIKQGPTPQAKLAAFAEWTTVLLSSSKLMIKAASGAATEPAMMELRAEGDRRRREGLRGLIGALALDGALPKRLSEGRALDRAWMVTGVDLYLSATDGCGWSDDEYQQWLTALLHEQLLIKPTANATPQARNSGSQR